MAAAGASYTQRFFALLEILKKNTDADHRLQQLQLVDILLDEYHMTVDRRSVRKALDEMQQAGYPVLYDKGWYYKHQFSKSELNYLADSVRFNNCLAPDMQARLLGKMASLRGKWYASLPDQSQLRTTSPCFLENLEVLHSAINDGIAQDQWPAMQVKLLSKSNRQFKRLWAASCLSMKHTH